jgi:hypothetical protein
LVWAHGLQHNAIALSITVKTRKDEGSVGNWLSGVVRLGESCLAAVGSKGFRGKREKNRGEWGRWCFTVTPFSHVKSILENHFRIVKVLN